MLSRLSLVLLIVSALVIAGCGSIATLDPTTDPNAVAEVATEVVPSEVPPTATIEPTLVPPSATPEPPTATPEPPTATPEPTLAPTHDMSGMASAGGADPRVTGNAENGKVIFTTFYSQVSFACATCHLVDSNDRLIGPGLLNISDIGSASHAGHTGLHVDDAYAYIYESITNPSAFVVPDYPDGLMPQIWAQVLTEAEIQDVIAYLYTLKG